MVLLHSCMIVHLHINQHVAYVIIIILLNNKLHSTFQVECSAKMKILEESLRSEVNQVILQMKGKVL